MSIEKIPQPHSRRVCLGIPIIGREILMLKARCDHRVFLSFLIFILLFTTPSFSDEKKGSLKETASPDLVLLQASICEAVKDGLPINEGVAFSVGLKKVACFSSFDPVSENTFVYHSWFFRDRLITRFKLALRTPRWATFSRVELRDADKGPWRVEISDEKGIIFHILRFSITD